MWNLDTANENGPSTWHYMNPGGGQPFSRGCLNSSREGLPVSTWYLLTTEVSLGKQGLMGAFLRLIPLVLGLGEVVKSFLLVVFSIGESLRAESGGKAEVPTLRVSMY
ncbi:hypothetical protein Zmor_015163 [Zophobas morio]|uniref:Uncharacterized protein n=1 Tax=Zophobas morio TaxID=2755281 RepID=A0AA38MGA8_9CUCU|nr:hypothetical protein Zmor_015163 [Zophobas morio]